MVRLNRIVDHYRELSTNLMPDLSDEVVEVADEIDFEIAVFVATSENLAHTLAEQQEGRRCGRSDARNHRGLSVLHPTVE